MRPIKEGDRVRISYTGIALKNATVISTPAGEGDLWYFRDENGTVFAQNPYYHKLNMIVLIEAEGE